MEKQNDKGVTITEKIQGVMGEVKRLFNSRYLETAL